MKVLLVNPPWQKGSTLFGVRAGSRWPFTVAAATARDLPYVPFPFFLAYAASLLEQDGLCEVGAIDAIGEGLTTPEYEARLQAFAPDVIVAETATASAAVDMAHAVRARELLGPDLRYIAAGPHASTHAAEVLKNNQAVDMCLVGEYEWTLRDLVRCWTRNEPIRSIPSIARRTASGEVQSNPRRSPGVLDELPWPAWHHFPMLEYKDFFCGIQGPMANLMASRGCPYTCNFCLWPEVMYGGNKYRARTSTDVADEMQALVDTYNFSTLYFDDDTFNLGKARMLELADAIIQRRLNTDIAIMGRADSMDREILERLKQAGLVAVKYGVESGCQKTLQRIGKNLDLDRVRSTVAMTKELGIKVHLTFAIGLMGETEESMQRTMDLALELDPDSLQTSYATPFPGTAYYRYARERGFLSAEENELYDGSHTCVVRTEHLTSQQIEQGMTRIRNAWTERCATRS